MKLRSTIAALHAALIAILLAVSPALAGSMTLLGAGKSSVVSTCCVLDGITTGIQAAHSTRKLLTAYAGSALAVTRASDHTAQNIGFSSNVLDTASLATFCSATTCVVTTWYDQSGNGFDQTTTEAFAPTIYSSGAVKALNTKPAILFSSAVPTTFKNGSLSGNPSSTRYHNAVISFPVGADQAILAGDNAGGLEWRISAAGNSQLLESNIAQIGISSGTVSNNVGAIVEAFYNQSTGAFSFFINSSASGTGTNAIALTAGTLDIGSRGGAADPANGLIGELIIYDQSGGISGGNQATIEANQKTYWGTP